MTAPRTLAFTLLTFAFLLPRLTAGAATLREQADGFFQRGVAAEARGDETAAINCYQLALRVESGHREAQARLAPFAKKFASAGPLEVVLPRVEFRDVTVAKAMEIIAGGVHENTMGLVKLRIDLSAVTAPPVRVTMSLGSISAGRAIDYVCGIARLRRKTVNDTVVISPEPKPANPETLAKLSELEKDFQKGCAASDTAHTQALQPLLQSYAATLTRTLEASQKFGDRVNLEALRGEAAHLSRGGTVPEADPPGTPGVLAGLRGTYRRQAQAAAVARVARFQALCDRRDAALGAFAQTLQDKPHDLFAIAEQRAELAALRRKGPDPLIAAPSTALTASAAAVASATGSQLATAAAPRALPPTTPSASHCHEKDTVSALNDGKEPASSADTTVSRFTWHPRYGSYEWVQYDFAEPAEIEGCSVFWYADADRVKLPGAWSVLYLTDEGLWLPTGAHSDKPTADEWNTLRFAPVRTKGLRIASQLVSNRSAGILEWKVIPASTRAPTKAGLPAELPLDWLIPTEKKVGFGPYRVNRYLGFEEDRGARILVGGAPCSRFLFTHASSRVSFALPAGSRRFTATGIAPSHLTNPSWDYAVEADGAVIFKSESLNTYPSREVKIDVALPPGTRTLSLITDARGSENADHSLWAEPKVHCDAVAAVAAMASLPPLAPVALAAPQPKPAPAPAVLPPSPLRTTAASTPPAGPALSGAARLRKVVEKLVTLDPNGVLLRVDGQVTAQRTLPLPARAFDIHTLGFGGELAKAITDEDVDMLGGGRGAERIVLNDAPISRLDGVKPHDRLLVLSLNATRISDASLETIAGLRSLQELGLNGTKITGAGLAALKALPNLNHLSVWDTPLKDDDLALVGQFRNLKHLNIGNTQVTGSGLAPIADLPKLAHLWVDGLALSAGALEPLARMKALTMLDLNGSKLDSAHLGQIAAVPALEILQLSNVTLGGNQLVDADLSRLASLSKLKELLLNQTSVNGSGLAALTKARGLDRLELEDNTALSDEGFLVAVRTFPALTRLTVGGRLTETGVAGLSQLKKLRQLRLNGPDISAAALAALPPLRSLEILEFHAPQATSAVAPALAKQSGLTTLSITATKLSDDAIPHLTKLKNLRQLHVGTAPISPAGIEALRKALPGCTVTK